MGYETILESFIQDFSREYGEKKVKDIYVKVENSKSVRKALQKLKDLNTHPGTQDVVSTVMNIPYFMFGKKQYAAMGSIIFLAIWNEQSNINYKYLDDSELTYLFRRILNECGQML